MAAARTVSTTGARVTVLPGKRRCYYDLGIRPKHCWETIGLAVLMLAALVVTAVVAGVHGEAGGATLGMRRQRRLADQKQADGRPGHSAIREEKLGELNVKHNPVSVVARADAERKFRC
ncbi:hypothetical protein KCP69_10210 [Salmonella enterica subsp. enterica]|nr:hypothetical protein KCP69_10210 [Salmonella enterica subsp. enterica]